MSNRVLNTWTVPPALAISASPLGKFDGVPTANPLAMRPSRLPQYCRVSSRPKNSPAPPRTVVERPRHGLQANPTRGAKFRAVGFCHSGLPRTNSPVEAKSPPRVRGRKFEILPFTSVGTD